LPGEGRGEGRFFEFGQEHLENPIDIVDDIVVPDSDHAITERAQLAVASPVFGASRMPAAVELDNQVPAATNKVDIEPTDRFLADEFDAAELPAANVCPNAISARVRARRNDRARSVRF
jgi:hypothetical protein